MTSKGKTITKAILAKMDGQFLVKRDIFYDSYDQRQNVPRKRQRKQQKNNNDHHYQIRNRKPSSRQSS